MISWRNQEILQLLGSWITIVLMVARTAGTAGVGLMEFCYMVEAIIDTQKKGAPFTVILFNTVYIITFY